MAEAHLCRLGEPVIIRRGRPGGGYPRIQIPRVDFDKHDFHGRQGHGILQDALVGAALLVAGPCAAVPPVDTLVPLLQSVAPSGLSGEPLQSSDARVRLQPLHAHAWWPAGSCQRCRHGLVTLACMGNLDDTVVQK